MQIKSAETCKRCRIIARNKGFPRLTQMPEGVSACMLHEIEDEDVTRAFFTCTSGELLWGQVHTVIADFASAIVDAELGSQQTSSDDPPAGGYGGGRAPSVTKQLLVRAGGRWRPFSKIIPRAGRGT